MTRTGLLSSTLAAVALVTAVTGAHAWSIPAGRFSTSFGQGPLEVLIIRSAEEPKGSDVHLSAAGKARAKALAKSASASTVQLHKRFEGEIVD